MKTGVIAGAILAAGAASQPAGPAATPAARVEGNAVVHPGERVTVRVPASALYVGAERFVLHDVADAEVHVFAEADASRRIRTLYWIQFESYLPSVPDRRFNYAEGNSRLNLWGSTTWVRAGPRPSRAATRPGSDREHVLTILDRAGYDVPPEMMNVRLVQILDDPAGTGRGRRELMLIHAEDLAPTGKRFADLVEGEETTPAWQPLEQPLIERAKAAFRVERHPEDPTSGRR